MFLYTWNNTCWIMPHNSIFIRQKIVLHNCKLFMSKSDTLSSHCLLRIIISHLKLYKCVQTNDDY